MSVTPQDVEKVALLARLAISESDLPEVTERFARVLNLVDELNTIDTESVIPMSNPHDMEQRLRPDIVTRDDKCCPGIWWSVRRQPASFSRVATLRRLGSSPTGRACQVRPSEALM